MPSPRLENYVVTSPTAAKQLHIPIRTYADKRKRSVRTIKRWVEDGILDAQAVIRIKNRLYVDEAATPRPDAAKPA